MNLYGTGSLHPKWHESGDSALSDFADTEMVLLDMNFDEDGEGYNWFTNQGGTVKPTVAWRGKAQFQLYRFSLTMDDVAGSVGNFRPARITIDKRSGNISEIPINKGMQVRVLDCPENPMLRYREITINSGVESGHAFRRVIEAEINLARVVPLWTD